MKEISREVNEYDYIVVGSGFGGSVSALRLSEKGYNVLVIESGKWFTQEDFPNSNWNLKRWLWFPFFRFFGIMKISLFRHITFMSGKGVGGGSLVYANTLPIPKNTFYNTGTWKGLVDWESELAPHYKIALSMLGAAKTPRLFASDKALKSLAQEIGRENHFEASNVAVFFGEENKTVSDPYFQGQGPQRTGCNFCGGCMTGCRYGAKNTLDKNYLFLAQRNGAEIMAEKEVFNVVPLSDDGSEGYEVHFKDSTRFFKEKGIVRTKGVIFSGGVIGSVKLLLKLKNTSLPKLSNRLGYNIRTNNESLIPVTNLDDSMDLSQGVAIGSILHTDDNSHLEPVRYSQGSGFWRLLLLPMVSGGNVAIRLLHIFWNILSKPIENLKFLFVKDWAKSTSVMLFMQHLESTLRFKRNALGGMSSKTDQGKAPSADIPEAGKLAEKYARILKGKATSFNLESLLGIPSTAHILGGAVMGEDSSVGVIDRDNKVFGYENMLVCDGSMISANPGVNPALSITAISERAMSKVAEKNSGK